MPRSAQAGPAPTSDVPALVGRPRLSQGHVVPVGHPGGQLAERDNDHPHVGGVEPLGQQVGERAFQTAAVPLPEARGGVRCGDAKLVGGGRGEQPARGPITGIQQRTGQQEHGGDRESGNPSCRVG